MAEQNSKSAVLSGHELSEIKALIESRSGVLFDSSRERFFLARVQEHLEAKRLAHGADLLRLMRSSNVEFDALLARLLTQETSFFRYPDVFNAFQKKVLPEMHMKKFWENPRRLRIWSAGCSTGEEPYSIGMAISDTLEFIDAWDIQLLATDISRSALQHAERGVYTRSAVEKLAPVQVDTYFARVGDQYMVKPKLRNMISFAPMNLAQPVYVGRFDCIFCMNVMIYFSEDRRNAMVARFHDYLEPGGYLFLGHADNAANAPVKFKTILHGDSRIFQKSADAMIAPAGTLMPGEVTQ
jgi:chemotaxis protein methyltransferase CheR